MDKNPRSGYCSWCPNNIYDKTCKRTLLHHSYYIRIFPWFGTVELCDRCHINEHTRIENKYLSLTKSKVGDIQNTQQVNRDSIPQVCGTFRVRGELIFRENGSGRMFTFRSNKYGKIKKRYLVKCMCGTCILQLPERDRNGKRRFYINGHQSLGKKRPDMTQNQKGEKNHMWKGGKTITTKGYIRVLMDNHPYADTSGRVGEHRLVFEKYLGRYLTPAEDVHHLNGIKTDNRIENLQLICHDQHTRLHHEMRRKSIPLQGKGHSTRSS
jgi:hypothetical protein